MLIRYNQSNKLANKLGAEAFWPMTLDKESDKAAAILHTFTRDGFQVKTIDRDGNHTKSLVKIPPKVLQEAKGLAIFTVFRTGLLGTFKIQQFRCTFASGDFARVALRWMSWIRSFFFRMLLDFRRRC